MGVNIRCVAAIPAHNGDYVNFERDIDVKERVIISIDGEGWSVLADDLIHALKTVIPEKFKEAKDA